MLSSRKSSQNEHNKSKSPKSSKEKDMKTSVSSNSKKKNENKQVPQKRAISTIFNQIQILKMDDYSY